MPLPFNLRVPSTINLTAAQVDANFSALAVDARDFYIPTVANQDYTVAVKMPHGGTINETTTKSISGTCTITTKVNAVALGVSNAASATLQSQPQATANTFIAGDSLVITVSANATCLGLAYSLKYSRTLD